MTKETIAGDRSFLDRNNFVLWTHPILITLGLFEKFTAEEIKERESKREFGLWVSDGRYSEDWVFSGKQIKTPYQKNPELVVEQMVEKCKKESNCSLENAILNYIKEEKTGSVMVGLVLHDILEDIQKNPEPEQ